jgi:hypothetical protein
MVGAADANQASSNIHATHPAQPGTYIVYAHKDGSTDRTAVVLWGVLDDGTAVPLTLSGVWDGVANRNNFVLHPDGTCGKFEENWDTLEDAVQGVEEFHD